MSSKSQKIKLGVLNMTICLEDSKITQCIKRSQIFSSSRKNQFLLTPKNERLGNNHLFLTKKRLNNIMMKQQSNRYINDKDDNNMKINFQNIQLTPRINDQKLQNLSYRDNLQLLNKNIKNMKFDNSFQYKINKGIQKKIINLQRKEIKSGQRIIIFNINDKPINNLKSLFTINPVKTLRKFTIPIKSKQLKRQKLQTIDKITQSRKQNRIKYQQIKQNNKKLRPWSTNKNISSKINKYQYDLFDQYDPQLIKTN